MPSQSIGLGDYFLSKRFPFAIYYRVDGDAATVVALLDARRNPQWIRRRLG